MPNYNASGTVYALYPGDEITLFDAETPTAPQASQQVAMQPNKDGGPAALAVQVSYASAPTATLDIQAANVDADANYVTIGSSQNTQHDLVEIGSSAAFIRVNLASQSAGGAVTVVLRRSA